MRIIEIAVLGDRPGEAAISIATASSARGQPIAAPRLLECHDCGARYAAKRIEHGTSVQCHRCGATMEHFPLDSLDRSLALAIAGLILFVIVMTMPFISLTISGRLQEASFITGVIELYDGTIWPLGIVVMLTTVLMPVLKLLGSIYVLVGLRLRRTLPGIRFVFRAVRRMGPWSMIEVYLLGLLVAYVKLAGSATVVLGPAVYALATLMVVMIAIDVLLSRALVWHVIAQRRVMPVPAAATGPKFLCEVCGVVVPVGRDHHCPRCGAACHARKPDSITRSWALTLAALILYVPANLYPVMTVISFGAGEPDTIVSGVEKLLIAGMWPLALLVFFASITVPVLKLVGLLILLITTQLGLKTHLHDRTVLYRIVEAVGRWSMIDIFMLSILAGLVQLGSVATIEPGVGALAFAGVVIVTMFAANSFDPRLMWDVAGTNK